MVLAGAYAIADFVGSDRLTMPQMARTHGVLNGVGFCLLGIAGMAGGDGASAGASSLTPSTRPASGAQFGVVADRALEFACCAGIAPPPQRGLGHEFLPAEIFFCDENAHSARHLLARYLTARCLPVMNRSSQENSSRRFSHDQKICASMHDWFCFLALRQNFSARRIKQKHSAVKLTFHLTQSRQS